MTWASCGECGLCTMNNNEEKENSCFFQGNYTKEKANLNKNKYLVFTNMHEIEDYNHMFEK